MEWLPWNYGKTSFIPERDHGGNDNRKLKEDRSLEQIAWVPIFFIQAKTRSNLSSKISTRRLQGWRKKSKTILEIYKIEKDFYRIYQIPKSFLLYFAVCLCSSLLFVTKARNIQVKTLQCGHWFLPLLVHDGSPEAHLVTISTWPYDLDDTINIKTVACRSLAETSRCRRPGRKNPKSNHLPPNVHQFIHIHHVY